MRRRLNVHIAGAVDSESERCNRQPSGESATDRTDQYILRGQHSPVMRNTVGSGLKMLRCSLLAFVLASAFPALADGPLAIPRSEQTTGGYLSTALLLKPCLDIREWSPEPNDDLLKQVAEARKGLPPNTCESPALVEKLFKARFLQYASIAVVSDPWNLDAKIRVQNEAIGRCKDTECLDRELDAAITALSPVYLNSHPEWPNGTGLCMSKAVDVPANKVRTLLGPKIQKGIVDKCAPESFSVQTCGGGARHPRLCGMHDEWQSGERSRMALSR